MKRFLTSMKPTDYLSFACHAAVHTPCTIIVFLLALALPVITAIYLIQYMSDIYKTLDTLLPVNWLIVPIASVVIWSIMLIVARLALEIVFGCLLIVLHHQCTGCSHE